MLFVTALSVTVHFADVVLNMVTTDFLEAALNLALVAIPPQVFVILHESTILAGKHLFCEPVLVYC